ncbi:MAG: tetratricopeptide repeat protein [Bdellovibrionales bacterium]|nr:tetratricopeptide repeat protein [Bdellovibrionales bacterium]
MKFLSFFFLLVLTVSCIKTAEQVQRERRVESMSEQMRDSQGLVADMVSQMKDMQGQLDKLNGRMEEMEHKNKKLDPDAINKMNENVNLVKNQQEAQGAQLLQIQNELKEQRAFIEKVTANLSNASSNKPQKKNAKEELAQAINLVYKHDYKDARSELEPLIDHPDLSPGDKNKVFYNLGKVEYSTKNYEKGLVFFSKIFSNYPKSSLAPSSLLFIARCLKKMNKKEEAKEAFAKVIEDYADTSEAKEAKKEI